ncbi:MAG: SapC family protein [Pseudomonadota bacterium]
MSSDSLSNQTASPAESGVTPNGADTDTPAESTPAEGERQTPIFYKQPEPLDARRHGALGLNNSDQYAFAGGANAIPIHVGEFALIARDYPIVFVGGDTPMPVAIVGIRQNENLFVEGNGGWAPGRYIPAYVRRYPFLFLRHEEQNQLILCFDRASERVAEGAENPLFDGETPSEFTKNALEFATGVQKQFSATERFAALLKGHDLLTTQQRSFTLYTGERRALTDFQVVDEAKFNALDDEAFAEMRRTGAIGAVYCHLVSLNSWVSLVHRANQLLNEEERARTSG